ncbi:MAG: methylated-DNA--[protein]-cysteine S-methyltransferase [Planctomycetota bacterium]
MSFQICFTNALGAFCAIFSRRGLVRLAWERKAARDVVSLPASEIPRASSRSAWARLLEEDLRQYAGGERVRFIVPIDWSAGTPFQRRVRRALLGVPWGEGVTYGDLASRIGRPGAARAVGAACKANPIPIVVPCHRVLASGLRLGGYGGGLERKRRLLDLEGIPWRP